MSLFVEELGRLKSHAFGNGNLDSVFAHKKSRHAANHVTTSKTDAETSNDRYFEND